MVDAPHPAHPDGWPRLVNEVREQESGEQNIIIW